MRKSNGSFWAAIAVLIFSLIFFYQSLAFPYSGDLGPGPGFFPTWLSGILFILSVFYIFESLKAAKEDVEDDKSTSSKDGLKNVVFILASMIGVLILLPILGFVISGTLFLSILLFKECKWYSNLSISLGVSLILFFVFDSALHIPLPVNILGF